MKDALIFRTVGLVLMVFMMAHVVSPALANGTSHAISTEGGREYRDDRDHGESARKSEDHGEKDRCEPRTPESFTEIPDLAFDHSLVEATPHWIFLAAGDREKRALLSYLDRASVSEEKRSEWKQFMKRIWEKYPVAYEKIKSTSRIVLGNPHRPYSLTNRENETFREIELYIAEEMEMTQGNSVIIQWAGDTHSNFIREALSKELIIDNYYLEISTSSSQAPDDWYVTGGVPFEQQYNHGYVPVGIIVDNYPWVSPPKQIEGIGTAPNNFARYAQLAKMSYASRNYDTAFENMGYASHFLSDLGNPFHTPNAQVIPLQYVDLPFTLFVFPNAQILCNYKALHDEYEGYANDHLVDFGDTDESTAISDPLYSAKAHGLVSWAISYPLMYQCYWHYVIFRNFDFPSGPGIVYLTKNRITETAKLNRGLVRYVTAGKAITYTITPSASKGGSISPSSPVTLPYGQTQLFTITPEQGFLIQDVRVNGKSMGPVSQFIFNMDTIKKGSGDQTIDVHFAPASLASSDWVWARDGWGDWEHTTSWSGLEAGPNSEYGPLMVEDHGQHGIQISLVKGAAVASTWRTFYDPTGVGWKMLTFEGALSPSDRPSGRWMKIEVNGVQVFGATEVNIPPGSSGAPFTVKAPFLKTSVASVNISHGQNPAWGPLFALDYYSIKFYTESDAIMTQVQQPPSGFMADDRSELNTTETDAKI
jgi:hypothetical protein